MTTATCQISGVRLPVTRIDGTTAAQVRQLLNQAIDDAQPAAADPMTDVLVDLSRVEMVDAVGLGVLMGAHQRAIRSRVRLRVDAVPLRVNRVLHATGLARVLGSDREDHGSSGHVGHLPTVAHRKHRPLVHFFG